MTKQNQCINCDAALSDGQRFCSSCGDAADGPVLLNVGGPTTTTTSVSTSNGSSGRWLAGLGLLLAAVVGWSLITSGGSDVAGEATDQEAASSANDGAEADGGDADGEGDSDDGESTSSTRSDDDDDQLDDEDSPVTTTGIGAAFERDDGSSGPARSEEATFAPLESSGLSVVLANPLRLVDLDTGIETQINRSLTPVIAIGDFLVIRPNTGSGTLAALPLNDLEADRVPLHSGDSYAFQISPGPVDGSIAMMIDRFDGEESVVREVVVDLATAGILSESETDLPWFSYGMSSGRFTSPRSGGVYERDGERLQKVAEGRLVAEGETILLTEECDDQLRCTLRWLDAETFEILRRPVPDDVADGVVMANDRLLVSRDVRWQFTLIDLETMQVIAENIEGGEGTPVSVGPNGRYVAFAASGQAIVLDLETSERTVIQDVFFGGPPVLIETR